MASRYDSIRADIRKRGQQAKEELMNRASTGGSSSASQSKYESIRNRPASAPTPLEIEQSNQVAPKRLATQESRLERLNVSPTTSTPQQVAQNKLGQNVPVKTPFQQQPVSDKLLPANANIRAVSVPQADNPIQAAYQQAIHGAQSAINFQQQPTSEVPSTGKSWLDTLARETGSFLPGLASGQTEMQGLKAAGYVLPKLFPEIPAAVNKIATVSGLGALENAAVGAASGQTSGKEIGTNLALGAGFGAAGGALEEAISGAGRYARKIAQETTRDNLAFQKAVQEVGEQGARADVGKRNLADIDEQIQSLSNSSASDKQTQFTSLFNERNDVINYIKQHEPDFVAPTPRVRTSGIQPEVKPYTSFEQAPAAEQNVSKYDQVRAASKANKKPEPQTRGFMQSLGESPLVSNEVKQGLEESAQRTYKPVTNLGQVTRANRAITRDADKVEAELLSKRKYTGDDVAKGIRTIQELQNAGNHERAVSIAEKLSAQLTEAGQTVQAASILDRLSPEGALLMVQRKVNKVNEDLLKGKEPVKISPQQSSDIQQAAATLQAKGVSQERAGNVLELMTKAKSGEALTAEEKQTVLDFVKDAKQFVKAEKAPAQVSEDVRLPKEFANKQTRERVVSFLDRQEQAAKDRIAQRRGRLSSTPFDEWADYAIIGASKLAKGALKFSDFSASMIRDFGEEIRPYLRKIYQRSGELLRDKSRHVSETAVSDAERIAESYLRSNEARLKPEDISLVRDLALKVSELSGVQKTQASQDLHAILNSFERVGVGRKLSAAQYIAMLLNPLTQIRNVAGNELMYRLERLARLTSTPFDIAYSKVAGKPRTVTFKSGPSVWDNFFTPTSDYWGNLVSGYKAGARGLNPAGLSNINEIGGLAFRSKYNPLTYLEKALGGTMKGFDHAAYQRSYNQQLREMAYLDALNTGIKGRDAQREHIANYMANLDGKAKEIADKYGQYVTLQDDSILSKGLSGLKRGLNKISTLGTTNEFGVGNAIIPFAKTPANLLLRSLDYSPAGIIKAARQVSDIVSNPKTDLTRADVISTVSRALLGSGIGALGYYLADLGVLQGKSSDDPEVRKLLAQGGIKDFQINGTALRRVLGAMGEGGDVKAAAKMQPGDTLWGYQWAAPTSAPLAVGNTVYQGAKEGKGAIGTAGKATLNGLETLWDSSVLRSLSDAFATQPGQESGISSITTNVLKNLPGTFLPSLVRQINTFNDERVKETYDPDALKGYINPTYQNVPGNNLPQRVDTLGRPIVKPSTFFDVFLNPAARTKFNPTAEAKFAIDLLQETGDNTLAPRAVSKYITSKGVRQNLTTEQYVRLQTLVGQKTAELIQQINPNLPTEDKAAAMLKALNTAGKYGRDALKKELGLQ